MGGGNTVSQGGCPKPCAERSDLAILATLEGSHMTTSNSKPVTVERKIAQRWGASLANSGWAAIPNVIIKRQKALGLDPLDVNIIMQLIVYWWEPGNLPRPSKKTIAAAIDVDPRTVQRRIAEMEKAGFIKRISRGSTANGSAPNMYDFSGLIKAAEPFAREELQEIEQRKKASVEKLSRKRPRLAVVNG